jgi:hypothetical protein
MGEELKVVEEEKVVVEEKDAIDIAELYDQTGCSTRINVTYTKHSNIAYINVGNRDVHIDFLELPGVRTENEVLIDTTRVYMSHSAAQKLAAALQNVLKAAHSKGGMEVYEPEESD